MKLENKKNNSTIKRLTRIAIYLSSEKDLSAILKLILDEAISFTNADGATIYLLNKNKRKLDFSLIYNRTLNIEKIYGRDKINWPSVDLYQESSGKRLDTAVSYAFHRKEKLIISDIYKQNKFNTAGTYRYDEGNNYKTQSVAVFPLKDHEEKVIGILQLINAVDDFGNTTEFQTKQINMLTALTSLTAIRLTQKELIESLENLLYQFIRSIAKTLDRKSKHTAGHISRVAELTKEFALSLNKSDKGDFRSIDFDSNKIEEITLAAWMHDIGKIITPAHILDKSKKLEKIFDRFELIKTRIELIKTTIEKDLISEESYSKSEELKNILKRLVEYESIIDKVNKSDFLSEDEKIKIEEIAEFKYQAKDKTYYILNNSETRNLLIKKGNLLPEEIDKIRHHVTVTGEILEELSFPEKVKQVPFFAKTHHELLDGSGYPNHLTKKDLPIQSQIIALADIFEALTANDRPYKKPMALSKALKIIAYQAKDGKLSKKLLDHFLTTKLFMKYAYEYLNDSQIDTIDTNQLKEIYHNEKNNKHQA